MLQKFFENTIESKFIKQLLSATPLPLYKTISYGQTIIKDHLYIFRDTIILCNETGPFSVQSGLLPSESLFPDDYLYPQSESAKFTAIGSYIFGENYPGVTSIFYNKYNYYDVDTHIRLGKYLRCLRDIYEINLMPFYNCFAYQILDNFYINERNQLVEGENAYKNLLIPISFNTDYTIALTCPSEVKFKSVILTTSQNTYVVDMDKTTSLAHNSTVVKPNTDFNKPFIYRIDTTADGDGDVFQYEEQLYLLIQLPSVNPSSIVVLEGNYTTYGINHYVDVSNLDNLTVFDMSLLLSSKLSLLQTNTKDIYAFSDRLIEYLTFNAVTSNETISGNIYAAQRLSGFTSQPDCVNGVWNNKLRKYLYDKYMSKDVVYSNKSELDINGFVDKDVEYYLYVKSKRFVLLSMNVVDVNGNQIISDFTITSNDIYRPINTKTVDTLLCQQVILNEDFTFVFNSSVYSIKEMYYVYADKSMTDKHSVPIKITGSNSVSYVLPNIEDNIIVTIVVE